MINQKQYWLVDNECLARLVLLSNRSVCRSFLEAVRYHVHLPSSICRSFQEAVHSHVQLVL